MADTTDADTVNLLLTPSDVQGFVGVDAATVELRFLPSSADVKQDVDAGITTLKFTVSATDEHTTYDAGTVYLKLTPSGVEVYVKMIPQLVGVSLKNVYYATDVLYSRIFSRFALQNRWDVAYFGKGQ